MTVEVQIPYVILTGDGSQTVFDFSFGFIENLDLYVLIEADGVQTTAIENTGYTLAYDNKDEGGTITFVEAPADGSLVYIVRSTTISQQTDYEQYTSFPSETHEWNLDKITYILQELLSGALKTIDEDGNEIFITFDLSVTAGSYTVTINNSGGTDATIPPWVSGETAGVFHGEVTEAAPDDESATTQQDGYIWIEIDGT